MPATTVRMAAANSSKAPFLVRYPDVARVENSHDHPGVRQCRERHDFGPRASATIWRVAEIPSRSGMATSITITSGW